MHSWTLEGAMLYYTLINSHSQVRDTGSVTMALLFRQTGFLIPIVFNKKKLKNEIKYHMTKSIRNLANIYIESLKM